MSNSHSRIANRLTRRPDRAAARLALALMLLSIWFAGPSRAAESPQGTVLVAVTPARQQSVSQTITAFGRVQPDPDHVTSVTLPRAGLINRLWVRLGQRVQAGDPLLELDTAPNARMNYQQAKAAVSFARSKLARLQELFKEQLATRDQVSSAKRNLRDAQARLHAEKKLGTGQASEKIRAPFAGIVTHLDVSQGQRVQGDTTALLLASRDALVVPLGVEQEDATRLKPGMKVTLVSVFAPKRRINASVDQVHAMVDPKTRLVDVLTHLPKKATGGLVLGETMRGIVTLHSEQAVTVPRSAVLRDGKGSYLFVVHGNTAHRVAVQTGLHQDGWLAVDGDVHAGDAVVTLGNYELHDGMHVREKQSSSRSSAKSNSPAGDSSQ